MTKKQLTRLDDLANEAINRYLDKTDFSVTDWLDKKEAKEYCELSNLQFTDDKSCQCGQHNWK
jgi:hypothetical protein